MEPLEVTITITEDMLLRTYRVIVHRQLRKAGNVKLSLVFAIIIIIAIFALAYIWHDIGLLIIESPVIAFLCWYFLTLEKRTTKRTAKLAMSDNPHWNGTYTVRLYDTYVELADSAGSLRYEYDNCAYIIETDTDFFIQPGGSMYIIPKICCNEQLVTFLRSVIEKRKPAKREKRFCKKTK